MNQHIIDCCSLLNLYTGWGDLEQLASIDGTWHICSAVEQELEYTREYGVDGKPTPVRLNLPGNALLLPTGINGPLEMADYIDFACELDDGEAQALAIAKHRGWILLTDDNKARNVASRPDVAVPTINTPAILRIWAQQSQANQQKLPIVIKRIVELARFNLKTTSVDYAWWQAQLLTAASRQA
jgi:predicted nucleic acid-binding protein